MQSAEWRRCKMVPSEQTQPSPSTWHCSGSSGPSSPSWHVSGGSQAATHAWYMESLEHRKAAGAPWAPGLAQTPGRARRGLRAAPEPQQRVRRGLVSLPPLSTRGGDSKVQPLAKSSLPPVFANKVLLKHSHAQARACCIWLLLRSKGRAE